MPLPARRVRGHAPHTGGYRSTYTIFVKSTNGEFVNSKAVGVAYPAPRRKLFPGGPAPLSPNKPASRPGLIESCACATRWSEGRLGGHATCAACCLRCSPGWTDCATAEDYGALVKRVAEHDLPLTAPEAVDAGAKPSRHFVARPACPAKTQRRTRQPVTTKIRAEKTAWSPKARLQRDKPPFSLIVDEEKPSNSPVARRRTIPIELVSGQHPGPR